jgi:hypothetical protein
MASVQVPFVCDAVLWKRFADLCQSRDETPGAVLRDLVRGEVKRAESRKPRSDDVADEALLGRLRLLVAEALVDSRDWAGFVLSLKQRGLAVEPAGGGLTVHDHRTGRRLCKASEVGPAYLDLVRRFGAGLPGHPRPGLAASAVRARSDR